LLLPVGCVHLRDPETPEIEEARYDDAGIKTNITSQLLQIDPSKANDVNVHCFNGHVYLIGEADSGFRSKAVSESQGIDGVRSVTPHWFPTGTASTTTDASIENQIEESLFISRNITVRRLAVDVWGGNVVLTGVVDSPEDITRAKMAVEGLDGVKQVTSYLKVAG
jgi:hyperosmotically inducible protein